MVGGTFNASLLTIDNDVFEMVAKNDDTRWGCEDFDQCVMQHFIKIFEKKHKKNKSKDKRSLQKLQISQRDATMAKLGLSTAHRQASMTH